MLVLAAINWGVLLRLADLQDAGVRMTAQAGQIKHDANLGAQAYRVVADTYINQNFDEAARKWADIHKEIDASLALADQLSNTAERRQLASQAKTAIQEIRNLYANQYLPLSKKQVTREEIGAVDDAVDKQIDKLDAAYTQLGEQLLADAKSLDREFDAIARLARLWLVVAIVVGGVVIVVLTLVIGRSITSQLGMEPGEAAVLAHRIAGGDLTQAFDARHQDPASLAGALGTMFNTLRRMVSQVRQGADLVAHSSSEIAQGNHDLSARTESQASSLEETAAAMEQLNATVRQNADSAHQANQLALNASSVAVQGGEVVGQVVQTMRGIHDSSQRIADIIGVIDGIAFQTNILALNAAVEAARAGEQGRGFAVVASEVRSLAGRSAEAAKEIKTLISASVDQVARGTTLADQAGSTMAEVVSAIQRVTDLMGTISAASVEQSDGVSQVGEAVAQMDQVTQQNAALVEQMAAAASSLKSQAQDLVQAVAVFNTGAGTGSAYSHSV
ncbi:MAG: hypothetical protein IPH35_16220 [Rhodoferax sp.]|nr:hypothetical protein [Rhodoferax sp.]